VFFVEVASVVVDAATGESERFNELDTRVGKEVQVVAFHSVVQRVGAGTARSSLFGIGWHDLGYSRGNPKWRRWRPAGDGPQINRAS
jgi:hypothetical protein